MTGKTCTGCKNTLARENFYRHDSTKDKLRPKCIPCSRKEKYQYFIDHQEEALIRGREYRKNYPEKVRESKRKYIEAHYEECLERSRRYYSENREIVLEKKLKQNKEMKKTKSRIRDYLIEKYEGIPCMDCGGVFAWCAMDFDHRPATIKELKIGALGCQKATTKRIAQIEKEITKCDLVCSNCHRVRTQGRMK